MIENKNKENGFLVVEASLALFFLIFFMLFIWNFAGVFTAQNAVSHAALQTVQTISVDNMSKEMFKRQNSETTDVLDYAQKIFSFFTNNNTIIDDIAIPFADISDPAGKVEEQFYYILGGEDGKAVAQEMGIDTNNIEFIVDDNALSSGIIKLKINYNVKLKFGVFGLDSIDLTKCAQCQLFGYDR